MEVNQEQTPEWPQRSKDRGQSRWWVLHVDMLPSSGHIGNGIERHVETSAC